jgi:alpha-tubulin suppressor-like RCC1 family protein
MTATAVTPGIDHVIALMSDTTVWAWGNNSNGQLGNGTTTDSTTPVQVSGISSVTFIAAGNKFSAARRSVTYSSVVNTWGLNSSGQLGNGTTTDSTTPAQVSGISGVTVISVGYDHIVAVKSDGTVWTWGNNGNGQLGNGTTTASNTPIQVSGLTTATAVTAGTADSVVLLLDGTARAWGSNNKGQLGDGTTTDRWTSITATLP